MRTHKYDGAEHRRWSARLLELEGSLVVLDAAFAEDIEHNLLGKIAAGTLSTEYYWLDRWYNVFRFSNPDHSLRSFYCNLNLPPNFDGKVLSYTDLDIDVLVKPDFSFEVLDEDDFETNAEKYDYPDYIRRNVDRALADLIKLIETKSFPFS